MTPITEKTFIEGLIIIKPKVFIDDRGHFLESYNEKDWSSIGVEEHFVQDNHSLSKAGALRGMHFQRPSFAQAKLVRVIKGKVLDVVIDIRKQSATYGEHFSLILSGETQEQLYIPQGFAHGFLTLEDDTLFAYKCSNYYRPDHEDGILWNDPDLNINWGINAPLLSGKDHLYGPLKDFTSPF